VLRRIYVDERSVSLSADHRSNPSIKGDQRVGVSFGKGCQVSVLPGSRSNASLVMRWRQADSTWSGSVATTNPRSARNCANIRIRLQTQQAHLGYPAEGDGSVRLCGEPVACRHVVNVALSGERNPYVDIRQ